MVTPERVRLRQLMAVDALVGVALVVFAVFRTSGALALVSGLALAVGSPLAVRRRWPVSALVVVLLAGMTAITIGIAGDVVVLAIAFALYPVGLLASARVSALGLIGALAAVTAAALTTLTIPGMPLIASPEGEESLTTTPISALLFSATIITGSWALARTVRARRGHVAQLTELRARQAVAEERLRIARDIHDVVGHSLSLITMKAAVANHLIHSHPEEGGAALRAIERVSREALDDVRAVLGALRDPADAAPGGTALDRLVEDIGAAGVTVTVARDDLARVPAAVRSSAYRIVQEALTNVLRHAGPTSCRLTLAVEPRALRVSIVNEGTTRDAGGPGGHGLLGMRERVALHGGTLDVGAEPGGGYAVRAWLPYIRTVPNGE